MAALTAAELKFSTPLKVAVGAYWLTATQVEIPSGKEYAVGTLEIDPVKLGLTVGSVGGTSNAAYEGGAGEDAATTGLPAFVWCSPLLAAKTLNEAAKEVTEGYLATVSVVGGKVVLRVLGLTLAGDGKPINEAKTATKVTFTAPQVVTIFALGK